MVGRYPGAPPPPPANGGLKNLALRALRPARNRTVFVLSRFRVTVCYTGLLTSADHAETHRRSRISRFVLRSKLRPTPLRSEAPPPPMPVFQGLLTATPWLRPLMGCLANFCADILRDMTIKGVGSPARLLFTAHKRGGSAQGQKLCRSRLLDIGSVPSKGERLVM